MIKKYSSIVNCNIKENIKDAAWVEDLVHYGLFKNQMDGTLAAAALFCPDIICVKDYVFIKMFLENSDNDEKLIAMVERLEEKYNYCKKDIEMIINSWSLGDFFLGDNSQLPYNDEIIYNFGEVLWYFWQMRVNQLFPEKNIVVELGYELMGELGLCITMYEEVTK